MDQTPTNPPRNPWVPIYGRRFQTPIAYYKSSTHEIRVQRRWHGRKVWGANTLPQPDPSGDPETWVKVFASDAWMLLCEYNPALNRIRRTIRAHGDRSQVRANLPDHVRMDAASTQSHTDQLRTNDG